MEKESACVRETELKYDIAGKFLVKVKHLKENIELHSVGGGIIFSNPPRLLAKTPPVIP